MNIFQLDHADKTEYDIIDISPLINEKLAVFPGDKKFQRHISMDMAQGDHLGLSSIESTVHIGAHVDGPNHYHKMGVGIHQRALEIYLGPCQVIEVKLSAGKRIFPTDFSCKIQAKRILFKTNSFPDPYSWQDNFNSLAPELIDFLAEQNVLLVGLDTPSIDPAQDKTLASHNKIFQHDMAILEGVVLTHVTPGLYTLIALPLKLEAADAAPVRAVLLKNKED